MMSNFRGSDVYVESQKYDLVAKIKEMVNSRK